MGTGEVKRLVLFKIPTAGYFLTDSPFVFKERNRFSGYRLHVIEFTFCGQVDRVENLTVSLICRCIQRIESVGRGGLERHNSNKICHVQELWAVYRSLSEGIDLYFKEDQREELLPGRVPQEEEGRVYGMRSLRAHVPGSDH